MTPRLSKKPSGYFITIDGEVLTHAGKKGVISGEAVAKSIWRTMKATYPEKDIQLFEGFLLRP